MPTLLEVQRAMRRSLVERDDEEAAAYILAGGLAPGARLDVYRNTSIGALTTALRLSYPAVHRLVGAEFFDQAAKIFIETDPPHSAYLDEYGAAFPEFLAHFRPAAWLAYLPGVAQLEWAVSCALHAPDADPSRSLPALGNRSSQPWPHRLRASSLARSRPGGLPRGCDLACGFGPGRCRHGGD
jgi:hypothetical protein